MEQNKLLPCPFCGYNPTSFKEDGIKYIFCDNTECGICDVAVPIKLWNTRPPLDLPKGDKVRLNKVELIKKCRQMIIADNPDMKEANLLKPIKYFMDDLFNELEIALPKAKEGRELDAGKLKEIIDNEVTEEELREIALELKSPPDSVYLIEEICRRYGYIRQDGRVVIKIKK